MNKEDKLQILFDLTLPSNYPGGMFYDNYTGEQIPKITPENFGAMHKEICKLKAALIPLLEEDNG